MPILEHPHAKPLITLLLLLLLLTVVGLRSLSDPAGSGTGAGDAACKPTKWWNCPEAMHTGYCAPGRKAYRFFCRPEVKFEDCNNVTTCRHDRRVEEMDCAAAYSMGLCRPKWSQWGDWSSCLHRTKVCGDQQTSRRRYCANAVSRNNPAASRGSCRDRRQQVKWRRQGLPLGVQARACTNRRHCPKINGGWNEWGVPSACSVTCGIGYREVHRACDNPEPSGGGMPCNGFDVKRIVCQPTDPCPLDGHWCPWSHVERCDSSCGSGVGIRLRECRCPRPRLGGKPCIGPETEKASCRLDYCPYAEKLFEDERRFIRDSLRATSQEQAFAHMGQSAPVIGGEIYLTCDHSMPMRHELFGHFNFY